MKQQGSVQVIGIILLTVVIMGLVGVLFWQNSNKMTANTKPNVASSVSTSVTPRPSIDPVSVAKKGIAQAMNASGYSGLENYMASSVQMALSDADGGAVTFSGKEVAGQLDQYYADYALNNKQPRITEWTSVDFENTDNTLLKKQAASNSFFDFKGTYVSIGKGSANDAFVAFRLNDQGKATYVFYGIIYGY